MAEFACPYCGHAVTTDAEDEHERCPNCDGSLLIAYRYRLVARRGELSGGELYEAMDDGFDERMAVLFAPRDADDDQLSRFIEGNRLFAELGGGRGLVRIYEVGGRSELRPYVVMEWIAEGTLESRVGAHGHLDMPTLIETAGDLLTGLAKAHRSMPSIVHSHIHPGKIGFLSADEIVMFGFEWAEQVFEQDSDLADAFIDQEDRPQQAQRRAADLRQLGHALFYAASGEWIGKLSAMQQRARVRERMQGPIALLLDRLLDAGASGYRTAVDAAMDLDRLLRGDDSWRPRKLPKRGHHSDLAASAWTEASLDFSASGDEAVELLDDAAYSFDDGDGDGDGDGEEEEDDPLLAPPSPSWPSQSPPPAQSDFDRELYARTARQLDAMQPNAAEGHVQVVKGGRVMGIIMFVLIASGMCVSGIASELEDEFASDDAEYEALMWELEQQRQQEELERQLAEIEAFANAEPVPAAELGRMAATYHYTGVITGPPNIAGPFGVGDKCEIWVEPNQDLQSDLNCRWYVDCSRGPARSTRRIYGGGTAGFSSCTLDGEGRPLSAQDEEDEVYDGAFMADFGSAMPMLIVQDRWLDEPTRVAISIAGNAEQWDAPVPETRLADRMDRELIQARMDRGELPAFSDEAPAPAPVDKLNSSDIQKVMRKAKPGLKNCGAPSGSPIELRIDVLSSGHVGGVNISPPQPPQIATCLSDVAESLEFPASREDLTFTYRLRP